MPLKARMTTQTFADFVDASEDAFVPLNKGGIETTFIYPWEFSTLNDLIIALVWHLLLDKQD